MAIPSIDEITHSAKQTFARFPAAVVAGIISCITCILLSESSRNENLWLRWVFLTCLIAIPLFTATTLYCERSDVTSKVKIRAQSSGYAFLIFYFSWLFSGEYLWKTPILDHSSTVESYRFLHFLLAAHLLASFVAFIGLNLKNAFWQLNRIFFLRFALATLYAVVLYAGLAAALGLSDYLLGPDLINYRFYSYLFYILTFIFHPWFFLAGIPPRAAELDGDRKYPRGLYNFTRFVLVPLVTVYLIILYLYIFKILLTAQIPRGAIGYLVSGVSIVGTLTILLLFPYGSDENRNKIRTSIRVFFYAILPLMGLLFFSLYLRISEYGFTMNRYTLLVLGAWLTLTALYFLFHKSKSIQFIPVSLFIIVTLTAFGPWSGYSTALRSQKARLRTILTRNNILQEGLIHKTEEEISHEDLREISGLFTYLVTTHGRSAISEWFQGEVKLPPKLSSSRGLIGYASYVDARKIVEAMGLVYYNRYSRDPSRKRFSFHIMRNTHQNDAITVKGYDYLISFHCYTRKVASEGLHIEYKKNNTTLTVQEASSKEPLLTIDISEYARELIKKYGLSVSQTNMSEESLQFQIEQNNVIGELTFESMYGEVKNDHPLLTSCKGHILLKTKATSNQDPS